MNLASRAEASEYIEIELALVPESAAHARAAVSPLRQHLNGPTFDDVRLMVSELLADALLAKANPSRRVKVEAQVLRGIAQVMVTFSGLSLLVPKDRPLPAEPGWGVYLVQTLATRWDARHINGNTCIWFEA